MLSGVTETFANWKLRNKSDVIKLTWHMYIPPYHISFPKKWGCEWRGAEGVKKYLPKNAMKLRKFPHFFCWGGGGGSAIFTKK